MRVLVKNVNPYGYPLEDKFRDKVIFIKAGESIEMEREEAILFKSQFKAPVLDKGGLQKPESFKALEIIPIKESEDEVKAPEFVCQACGKSYQTERGLNKHIAEKHADQAFDEDSEKAIKELED